MTLSTDKPLNILWISIEDTSPRFGCYGDPVARTPNIDRLAAGGCRFPNAFSTAGVCAPSRSAIITGMYQTSIGTHHMRTRHQNRNTPEMPTPYEAVPPPYVKPFTEYLRAAGYYCTNNSKTDYQFAPPVTAWDECNSEAHWRNRSEGQPFFAVFNPVITHESRMWPPSQWHWGSGSDEDHPLITDPAQVTVPPYLPDTPKVRETIARLYDNLEQADRQVGELLDQLAEDGLVDNTLVILWSDHGAGLPRGKRWPYDAGINIPLIVRWPGQLEAGSVSEQLVSLIDLGPTMLSLVGLQSPGHFQGQAFLGPEAQPREYIYATRDRHDESYDMVRAVRDKKYKYIRNFYPEKPYLLWIPYRNNHPILREMWRLHAADELAGPQTLMFQCPRPSEELYDVEKDPDEINNLVADPAHRLTLERMRQALADWRAAFGDLGDLPEDHMVRQWYPNGEQPTTAAPIFIPLDVRTPGLEASDGGTFTHPLLVQLHCSTQGASIAYTLKAGPDPHWLLYTQPLRLSVGQTTLRTKAIRIGYKESEERQAIFEVNG